MLGNIHRTVGITLLSLFGMIILTSCGGSAVSAVQKQPLERVQRSSDQKKPDKRPLSHYEATLRPTDFDKEIEEVQRIHIEEQQREQLIIPKDSMSLVEETILGFRIQILSTSNIDDAEESKRVAQQLFLSDTVYVVYDPPVYKVRVGDFQTRLESNGRLTDVQERGFKDAWVVPDNVLRRKWVAVRRDEDMPEE